MWLRILLVFLAFGIILSFLVSTSQAGTNNCKPIWKCPSPTPTLIPTPIIEPTPTETPMPTSTPIPTPTPTPDPDIAYLDQYYNSIENASYYKIVTYLHRAWQSFIPSKTGTLIKVKIYQSPTGALKYIDFALRTSPDEPPIFTQRINQMKVGWGIYTPNISITAGQTYYLELSGGNPIWFYNDTQPFYDKGSKFIDGIEDLNNDFLFETYIAP